jgi:hypothetical protein
MILFYKMFIGVCFGLMVTAFIQFLMEGWKDKYERKLKDRLK